MKWIIIFLLLLGLVFESNSQSQEFRNQRAQLIAFNVGFNGLIGGFGALINNDNEKLNAVQTFGRGFYRGAIGGATSHIGLSLTNQIYKQRNISLAWPARLINSVGSSIIQNTAEGKRVFERLHMNLYFTRLDYYPYQNKFKARLLSSSIYGILVTRRNANFNLKKSIQTGIFYFESSSNFSSSLFSSAATGQVSSIRMRTDLVGDEFYSIYAHEVAHIMQFDRKVGGNALLYQMDLRFKTQSNIYKELSRYVYFDLNGPIFYVAYKVAGDTHSCNLFEQEAENYSNRVAYKCSRNH